MKDIHMTPVDSHSDTALHLRQTFAAQLPRRIEEIARQVRALELDAWNPRRVDFLHRLLHSLSGSAETFGMEAVASVARPLEVNLARLLGRVQAPKMNEIQRIAESLDELIRVAQAQLTNIAPQETMNLERPPVVAESSTTPRIYVLRDIPEEARALQQILQDAHYQVEIFNTLESLQQACDSGVWPAVILIDFAQHEFDSQLLASIAQLRQQGGMNLQLLVVNGKSDLVGKLALYRAGVNHCLNAPLQLDHLLKTLASVCQMVPRQAYRILLLTQNQAQREEQRALLVAAGMQVQALAQPQQVIAALENFVPELIVLDQQDGVCELASLLQDLDPYANLVFQMTEAQMASFDHEFLPYVGNPHAFVRAVQKRAQSQRERDALRQQLQTIRSEREREHEAINQHAIVSMTDATGKIVFVNDKFCRVSGYSRSELIGRNHRILKSGQHHPAFYQDLWRSISHGHIWHGEICNRNKEGGLYWLDTTIAPLMDSHARPYQFLAIRTEVSANKEREKILQESQRMAKLGNWDDSNSLVWSDLMADMLARTAIPSDQHEKRQEAADVIEVVHRVVRADGQIRYVRESGHSTVGVDGRLSRPHGTVEDVTESTLSEQNLHEARLAAEFAGRAKPELLTNMSQQLRAPLNAILAYAQMMQLEQGMSLATAAVQTGAHEIAKTGQQLLALINDVLDLARVEAGRMEIRPSAVSVQALFVACEAQTVALAAANGISLGFDLGECVHCMLWADLARVKQALLSLISNAIKYNRPHGKVQVSCCIMPGLLEGGGPSLQIAVSDTGFGLSSEKLARLYTPFDRLGAEQGHIKGTGIGLLICRQLLQLMGGQMGVESTPGLGSTFWIELALVTESHAANPALAPLPEGAPAVSVADGFVCSSATAEVNHALRNRNSQELTSATQAWQPRPVA